MSSPAMCTRCESKAHAPSRRLLLQAAGVALTTIAAPSVVLAQSAPPKPENVLSPDQAFDRLMEGNQRYVQGVARRHDFLNEREALTTGQNPYAGILSCADSRIAPEYAFDAGRGDLFVCRVAGNFLNDDGLASFEYAVQILATPLLMVLGHQACGAVDAAVKSVGDGTTLPGHLPALVTALTPAVKAASGQAGNTLDNTIKQNVLLNVERLKNATPIVSKFVADGKVRVIGGVYQLDTGKVEILQ
ncbi:MAG TPA: carbonic anhydrase [Aestuariivirgaceae bacterium]|jgi:carbonic anhydrase|nr:carbonic anhydrase [Aestuariivirgaceae bacterium]